MVAVTLQALLPGTLAFAEAKGVDVSRFLCAPAGEISPEMRAAVKLLADLAGEPTPAEDPFEEHCSLCTLVHGAPLPQPAAIPPPTAFLQGVLPVRPGLGFPHAVEGPPIGARGPPSHL